MNARSFFTRGLLCLVALASIGTLKADGLGFEKEFSRLVYRNIPDFTAKGSYLYWSIQQDQMGFALEGINVNNQVPSDSKLITHNPKWAPGIRLEIDAANQGSAIGCRLAWTQLQTSSTEKARSHPRGSTTVGATAANTFLSNGSPFFSCESARSRWNFHLNQLCLDLQYLGYFSNRFIFNPFIGVMGAVIQQRQKIKYFGSAIDNGSFDIAVNRKNNTYGIGPRFGLDFIWKVCQNFNLVSQINAAYLYGKCNSKNNIRPPVDASFEFINFKSSICRGRPMASGLIGIEWAQKVCGSFALRVGLNYEFEYFWQQWHSTSNMIDNFLSGEGRFGDLSLQGITATIGLDF